MYDDNISPVIDVILRLTTSTTQMAACYSGTQSLGILNFLLDGAWDLENAGDLQYYIWTNFWDKGIHPPNLPVRSVQDLEPWLQVSRRAYDLGHEFGEGPQDFIGIYSIMGFLWHPSGTRAMEPDALRTLVHFFISHGADIEQVLGDYQETALLSVAHSGDVFSLLWLRALLEHGADHTAQDRYGRGPLHLTLRKQTEDLWKRKDDKWTTSMRLMEAKLVCLIRAGCSIYEVDNRGLTPTDLARGSCLRIVWENALRKVNMLDDKMLELLDEKVRPYYPFGPPGTDNKFLSAEPAEPISLCGTNQLKSQSIPYSTYVHTKITMTALKIFGTRLTSHTNITTMALKIFGIGLSMTPASTAKLTCARKKARMKVGTKPVTRPNKNARMVPSQRTRQSKSGWKRTPKKSSTPTPWLLLQTRESLEKTFSPQASITSGSNTLQT